MPVAVSSWSEGLSPRHSLAVQYADGRVYRRVLVNLAGQKGYTPEEDAEIQILKLNGYTYAAIASHIERSGESVRKRLERLKAVSRMPRTAVIIYQLVVSRPHVCTRPKRMPRSVT